MTTPSTTTTAAEILAGAKRREAIWKLCLRADLRAEFDDLAEQLEQETKAGGWTASSLADVSPVVALSARIEELRAEMLESTVTIRVRALRRTDFEGIASPHRNTDGEGYNLGAMAPTLVRECIADPAFTLEQFDQFWDEVLNEGQRDELMWTCWTVNTSAGDVPFSERASVVMRWREQKSSAPETGGSPAASSSDE